MSDELIEPLVVTRFTNTTCCALDSSSSWFADRLKARVELVGSTTHGIKETSVRFLLVALAFEGVGVSLLLAGCCLEVVEGGWGILRFLLMSLKHIDF